MACSRLPSVLLAISIAFALLLVGCTKNGAASHAQNQDFLASTSGYQAVLLSNGQVYFGKLEALDTPHPVLRDVFYVQTAQNKDTKETKYVLVKRGKEVHAPDRMILNPVHIILVEPVSKDSKVAELMSQSSGLPTQ